MAAGGDLRIGSSSKRKRTANASDEAAVVPDALARELARTLHDKFTLEEVESVCWELGINPEDLPTRTLSGKARQLVAKADALGKRDELSKIVKRERPN